MLLVKDLAYLKSKIKLNSRRGSRSDELHSLFSARQDTASAPGYSLFSARQETRAET